MCIVGREASGECHVSDLFRVVHVCKNGEALEVVGLVDGGVVCIEGGGDVRGGVNDAEARQHWECRRSVCLLKDCLLYTSPSPRD